ncbi:MAG: TonB-dependent receptor [Chitinophagales bacterium]|nr:TonB-dependent receptor [Bacteroidota bacterium]
MYQKFTKKWLRCISAMWLILLASPFVMGQNIEISGKVTDASTGEGLPGATVVVKGTTIGTVTDFDGNYSIKSPAGKSLQFSFVGYVSSEQAINNRSRIDVAMAPDVEILDEVVVIGYGTVKKEDATGAVAKITTKDFQQGALVAPDQLMAGKVAGVSITSNSGEPGAQSTVRIRGGTSLNASNEPLYVIDGVPIDNTPHDPGGQAKGRNPLSTINPSDIESITVLKDASSTAIYGSRGANGVVLITTKKGTSGQSSLSYDTYFSVANKVNDPDFLSANEFLAVVTDKAPNKLSLLEDANTNWYNEIFQTAYGINHALSVSGGNDGTTYRASVGYQSLDGIIKTSNAKRTNVGMNLSQKLFNDQLRIDANIKGAFTRDRFSDGGVVGSAISMAPTQPIYDANSNWGGYWEWANDLGTKNPIATLDLTQEYGTVARSIGNVLFDYNIPFVDGLSAKLNLGYDTYNGERERFQPSYLRSQFSNLGEIRIENAHKLNKLLESYLNYKRDFEKSKMDFTLGYSWQRFTNKYDNFRGTTLSTDLLGLGSAAPAQENYTYLTKDANKLISVFGRLNYDLHNKYLFTFTVRRDGSSRFGPNNQWGTFPSAAFAWKIMDEPFMADNTTFSNLKLRLGYGIVGNQDIANYLFSSFYSYSDVGAQVQMGDDFVSTVRPSGYDENIKWEQTQSSNIGLDFGLWRDRMTGSIDLYYKKTNDLLATVDVAAGTNLTNRITTNVGNIENKGIEFQLGGFVISRNDLSWNLNFNAAYNKNKITNLTLYDDPDFKGILYGDISGGVGNKIQIRRVDYPIDAFFVYEHKLDANGNPINEGTDLDMYVDVNADGKINDLDKRPYKQPAPKVILGLSSLFNVSNFDISFALRGNFGNYVYNNVASSTGYYNRVATELVPNNLNRDVLTTNFTKPQYFSDYYVQNASFVRMDYLTVGYTIPKIGKYNNLLRLYVTGQNLFVITDYTGLDPEIYNGIDNNLYPRSRNIIFGLSANF